MSLQKNLSNNMKDIRYNHGYSLTEFSTELAISRSSLQRILDGTSNPRMDTVEHIAKKLNMDPLSLLSHKGSKELQVAMPLLEVTDNLYGMPDVKKPRFLEMFQALVLYLTNSDS